VSSDTGSDQTLAVAKEWIGNCLRDHPLCTPKDPEDIWYPTRLIDLGIANKVNERASPEEVSLVITKDLFEKGPPKDQFYVTLSHCWGSAAFLCLNKQNMDGLQKGIGLDHLPRTHQDAISFARRLSPNVRYIWIDSLCIIQDDYEDWLCESAEMHLIYSNSYCNISATGARGTNEGLFFYRNESILSYRDNRTSPKDTKTIVSWVGQRLKSMFGRGDVNAQRPHSNGALKPGMDTIREDTSKQDLEKRKIANVSYWEKHVEDAPVNRRAWVLQERLMAPRVLHFCQSQIAWECRQLVALEFSKSGIALPSRAKPGGVVPLGKFKSLVSHEVNWSQSPEKAAEVQTVQSMYASMRGDTLSTAESPNIHIQESLFDPFANWGRVVEVYSKKQLTRPADKLIACAGIANVLSRQIMSEYVAGMWTKYLESQLLWLVDPVYENGRFSYPSKRPDIYRAPSFSWAAVDASRGIKYGEISEQGLLIQVEAVDIVPIAKDSFGMVKQAILELSGALRKIEMNVMQDNAGLSNKGSVRYGWKLAHEYVSNFHRYRIVFLDSPESDSDILGPNGGLYCLPARKDSAGYLICLLLQLERKDGRETGMFRRVGLTKIPFYDKMGQESVLSFSDEDIPNAPWDAERKKHSLRII
jgi:hypothetical protein